MKRKDIFVIDLIQFIRLLTITVIICSGNYLWNCASNTSATKAKEPAPKTTPVVIQSVPEKSEPEKPKDGLTDEERQRELLIQYNLGFPHYQQKEYAAAVPYLWKVVELDKEGKYAGVFRQLGEAYIQLEKLDTALIVYEMGVKKSSNDIFLHRRLEWLYASRGDVQKAISEYETILKLDPDNKEYIKDAITLYIRNNQIPRAVALYDKLVVMDPDNQVYIKEKMNLVQMMGSSENLVEEYEKLYQKDPQNKEYIGVLLSQYHKLNENEKALKMADALLALDDKNSDALAKKADILNNLMRFDDRIVVLRKIQELNPQNVLALAEIADSYNNLKQYASARVFTLRALKIDSNSGESWLRLGEAFQLAAEDMVDKRGGVGNITFDDKLMFLKAYTAYQKAGNVLETATAAKRKMDSIQNLLPTKEDKFMHPDQNQPKDPVYQWAQ